jgi:putative ABC transport system substrate-binding protein
MRRRTFFTLIAGAAIAWPLAARAQQAAKETTMPVIGALYGVSATDWAAPMAALRRGLGETGFVEGRNVAFEYRWAEGHSDRLPAMAADLVSRKVAVIAAGGSIDGIRAAMAATRVIPIVFTTGSDPVAGGLVASLNRPGGNVTGATFLSGELVAKKLELLHEALPTARRIAVLVNPTNRTTLQDVRTGVRAAASRLGLETIIINASSEREIDSAFATAVAQRVDAISAINDAYFESRRDQIGALALRHALPAMGGQRATVAVAGMLMGYGASNSDAYRQAGVYVGRILKGEKPADLPVIQPTKFELIINLKTAKALGLAIPEAFLLRADEVIE